MSLVVTGVLVPGSERRSSAKGRSSDSHRVESASLAQPRRNELVDRGTAGTGARGRGRRRPDGVEARRRQRASRSNSFSSATSTRRRRTSEKKYPARWAACRRRSSHRSSQGRPGRDADLHHRARWPPGTAGAYGNRGQAHPPGTRSGERRRRGHRLRGTIPRSTSRSTWRSSPRRASPPDRCATPSLPTTSRSPAAASTREMPR